MGQIVVYHFMALEALTRAGGLCLGTGRRNAELMNVVTGSAGDAFRRML